MHTECPEDYQPDEDEVSYLEAFGSRADAILAICDLDNVARWRAGELAGCGGGVTDDVEQRRRNWASAAYKKTKSRKQTLPRIAALQQQLEIFRAVGSGKSRTVTRKQLLARLDFIAIHGEPNHSIAAIRAKEAMEGNRDISGRDWLNGMVARFGAERTRRVLVELELERLTHIEPALFADTEKTEAAHADHDRGRSDGSLPYDAPRDGTPAARPADSGVERSRAVTATREPNDGGGSDRERAGARDGDGAAVSEEELRRRQAWIGL